MSFFGQALNSTSDRAKRRGISNNGIRDVSTTVDMTSTHVFSIWVNCYIITQKIGDRESLPPIKHI